MEGHSEGRGHIGVRKLRYFQNDRNLMKEERKNMTHCEDPDLDLCDQNCGTLDCRSFGCVINNSKFSKTLSNQQKDNVALYYRWEIPAGLSGAELERLADEISFEKKIDKDLVLKNVTQRLEILNAGNAETVSAGA